MAETSQGRVVQGVALFLRRPAMQYEHLSMSLAANLKKTFISFWQAGFIAWRQEKEENLFFAQAT